MPDGSGTYKNTDRMVTQSGRILKGNLVETHSGRAFRRSTDMNHLLEAIDPLFDPLSVKAGQSLRAERFHHK